MSQSEVVAKRSSRRSGDSPRDTTLRLRTERHERARTESPKPGTSHSHSRTSTLPGRMSGPSPKKDSEKRPRRSRGWNVPKESAAAIFRATSVDKNPAPPKSKKRSSIDEDDDDDEEAPSIPPLKRRRASKNGNTNSLDMEPDAYCWLCHKEGKGMVNCDLCPRAFHVKCLPNEKHPGSDWMCPECETIMRAECTDTQSRAMTMLNLNDLCSLLHYALQRMRHTGSEPFQHPVDPNAVPNYSDFIVHPMDLDTLEKNIKEKMYGCTDAFLADAKWLLHNCVVYNGTHHKLTSAAKMIVKICKHEMSEIEICPDCYRHSQCQENPDWFCLPCRYPHPLVWAKLKGYPFWPAKALRKVGELVDVRFFGAHDRSLLPVSQIFLLSKKIPVDPAKNKQGGLTSSINETNRHIQLLKETLGQFEYAPFRTPYDRENVYLQIKQTPEKEPEAPKKIRKKYERRVDQAEQYGTDVEPQGSGPSVDPLYRKPRRLPKMQSEPVKTVSASSKTASALKSKYNTLINTRRGGGTRGGLAHVGSRSKLRGVKIPDTALVAVPTKEAAEPTDPQACFLNTLQLKKGPENGEHTSSDGDSNDIKMGFTKVKGIGSCDKRIVLKIPRLELSESEKGQGHVKVEACGKDGAATPPVDRAAKIPPATLTPPPETDAKSVPMATHEPAESRKETAELSPSGWKSILKSDVPKTLHASESSDDSNSKTDKKIPMGRDLQRESPTVKTQTVKSKSAVAKDSGSLSVTPKSKLGRETDATIKDGAEKSKVDPPRDGESLPAKSSRSGVSVVVTTTRSCSPTEQLQKTIESCRKSLGIQETERVKTNDIEDDDDIDEGSPLQCVVSSDEEGATDHAGDSKTADVPKSNERSVDASSKKKDSKTLTGDVKLIETCEAEKMDVTHVVEQMDVDELTAGGMSTSQSCESLKEILSRGVDSDLMSRSASVPADAMVHGSGFKALANRMEREGERASSVPPGGAHRAATPSGSSNNNTDSRGSTKGSADPGIKSILSEMKQLSDGSVAKGKTVVPPVENGPLICDASRKRNLLHHVPKLTENVAMAPVNAVASTAETNAVSLRQVSEEDMDSSDGEKLVIDLGLDKPAVRKRGRRGGKRAAPQSARRSSSISSSTSEPKETTMGSPPAQPPRPSPQRAPPKPAQKPPFDFSKYHSKLFAAMQSTMEEMYQDIIEHGEGLMLTQNHQKEVGHIKWQHQERLIEEKHNFELELKELSHNFNRQCTKVVNETKKDCEAASKKEIEEVKKKQWCALCGKEAIFYCCWNTSYCDFPCQQAHWPEHMNACTQAQTGANAPPNATEAQPTPATTPSDGQSAVDGPSPKPPQVPVTSPQTSLPVPNVPKQVVQPSHMTLPPSSQVMYFPISGPPGVQAAPRGPHMQTNPLQPRMQPATAAMPQVRMANMPNMNAQPPVQQPLPGQMILQRPLGPGQMVHSIRGQPPPNFNRMMPPMQQPPHAQPQPQMPVYVLGNSGFGLRQQAIMPQFQQRPF